VEAPAFTAGVSGILVLGFAL